MSVPAVRKNQIKVPYSMIFRAFTVLRHIISSYMKPSVFTDTYCYIFIYLFLSVFPK